MPSGEGCESVGVSCCRRRSHRGRGRRLSAQVIDLPLPQSQLAFALLLPPKLLGSLGGLGERLRLLLPLRRSGLGLGEVAPRGLKEPGVEDVPLEAHEHDSSCCRRPAVLTPISAGSSSSSSSSSSSRRRRRRRSSSSRRRSRSRDSATAAGAGGKVVAGRIPVQCAATGADLHAHFAEGIEV